MMLFIVGEMKRGGRNHSFMDGSRYIGEGSLGKNYSLYVDFTTKLFYAPSESGVYGEVYDVDAATLKRIDTDEGCPIFSERHRATVTMDDGSVINAYVYIFQGGVESGATKVRSYNVQS
jgi:gamma-glutamylaminecyclotransferase